jgi:DNA-binding LacI/PurR family transcriptional regulator
VTSVSDRRPSIRDVAARAAVSTQTVSRVVNGRKGVAPETRDRVLEAIQEIRYRPDTAARALRSGGRSSIADDFEEAERRGYVALLIPADEIASRLRAPANG